MKLHNRVTEATMFAALASCVTLVLFHAPASAQAPRGGRGGLAQSRISTRVESRTYHFAETNEDLPYCVFVSSKVSRNKKNPLIVSLHGLGTGPGIMCRGRALDLAEDGGYILVAPMGYNTNGWYGAPVFGGAGRGAGGRGPVPTASGGPPASRNLDNLEELSEKDVMNVLAIMRKEFNVDDNRTYLMGHSMGGAGTFFLGAKHANEWAAIAPIAPAAFTLIQNRETILKGLKDAGVPVILVQGDADTAVPVANTRMWADKMKDLKMIYQYKEISGADHGRVIDQGMPDIFKFFKKHTRAATQ